jgi:hypothetical protein
MRDVFNVAVSKAVEEFRETAQDNEIGLAQLPYALAYEPALESLREHPMPERGSSPCPDEFKVRFVCLLHERAV